MKQTRYTLIKIPIQELIKQKFNITLSREEEIDNEYLIEQGDSLLFDQIERLRGRSSLHIDELILVMAKKNPKQEKDLKYLLENGFTYNGIHYNRFGKSASQGKEGITAFVCDSIFDELYKITQMDIPIKECVISKYESQRCLPFSTCTLINGYMPHIVIIGEYEKTLENQLIKYVVEKEKEYIEKETGKRKKYAAKEIEEGYKNITLSPFDGCGCHEYEFMEKISTQLKLDYYAIGAQIRLPFIKGFSVYVPFRDILKAWGYESITDIYGNKHPIDTVDCIWNISMFKGHKLFKEKYGNHAWTAYMDTLHKYQFKLGISKYSHHIRHFHKYTRMNFQYLQCLDLWNPKYIDCYENRKREDYDILNSENDGKIIELAKYTTALFEKIIKGDKFYTYKFMGITDTTAYEPESKYLEAVLVNDVMLHDPAIKQFIYRKLKKSIEEAKVGKIYCSGFYHTGVGDMIGYLQYAAGEIPTGCLQAGELYSGNDNCGNILSFRSPLVDPSEVNKIKTVQNDILQKWFKHFKDQDVVMFNMYDLSAPQQGGADFDGDIFFLCDDPTILDAKIDKKIILDMEDKATVLPKPYTKNNIIEYEIMTRDNRIGEITNAATSIENKYTTNEEVQKMYADDSSLLRIFQGKEIDFLKTGLRWHMNNRLRKHLKQLPYFLSHNYSKKIKTYHSPSPMNELCDYICAWEKRNILWDKPLDNLINTRSLITNKNWDVSDKRITKIIRRYINEYADEIRRHRNLHQEKSDDKLSLFPVDEVINRFRCNLSRELQLEEEKIANYVIYVSYSSFSISKAFAWAAYSDYIIMNLKNNSDSKHTSFIKEVEIPTDTSYEYLGKYYEFTEVKEDR